MRLPLFAGPVPIFTVSLSVFDKSLLKMEKSEVTLVRFTGKNYPAWSFQFQIYLEAKELWGYISGSDPKPTEDEKKISTWLTKDAKIKSWILGSVEPHLIMNLKPYSTSKEMWRYLKQVYHQDNSARQFHLECAIAEYAQGNLSIQDYYSGFQNLWSEYDSIKYADVAADVLIVIRDLQASSQRDQFLMKLRHEFDSIRSSLMNRMPLPSLDVCLNDLLREEQRLSTSAHLAQQTTETYSVAFSANKAPQPSSRDWSKTQCYSCHKFGHLASQCKQKVCSYCKKPGHIISECRRRPQRPAPQYQAPLYQAPSPTLHAYVASSELPVPPSASSQPGHSSSLTPELVQQMIVNALSALGLSGTSLPSSTWFLDSGASNHMTYSRNPLSNVKQYTGNLQIQTANGGTVPITALGDIPLEKCLPLSQFNFQSIVSWATC